jgi:hypothetical protein
MFVSALVEDEGFFCTKELAQRQGNRKNHFKKG